ncbi:MAG: hypothetical protein K9H16_02630 [Bacteroidales bacterium]|nr:hypothetical protein [Bacteroidales bacterium]
MEFLLSVDLGVKTGLAMFNSEGRLLWYRSQNFGNKVRLKKAIPWILNIEEDIHYLIIEGGGSIRKIWDSHLDKRNIEVIHIMAEDWRQEILLERERRKGKQAKEKAIFYAEKVIQKLSHKKTQVLNDNTAEAILIGFWGAAKLGWLNNPGTILR